MTGSYLVEDYMGENGMWFRQLLFENTLVQTSVRLKPAERKICSFFFFGGGGIMLGNARNEPGGNQTKKGLFSIIFSRLLRTRFSFLEAQVKILNRFKTLVSVL